MFQVQSAMKYNLFIYLFFIGAMKQKSNLAVASCKIVKICKCNCFCQIAVATSP